MSVYITALGQKRRLQDPFAAEDSLVKIAGQGVSLQPIKPRQNDGPRCVAPA